MNSVTHTQVQELIANLPAKKLPAAYELLSRLTQEEKVRQSIQEKFIELPLHERRQLLAQQTEEILTQQYYEETAADREEWQGGDFDDY